ncbi:MAG TPA: hypothetical protein VFQ35_16455 [Polyangiaceae bacterium]|nr:hypothetical protein [Polyangiaceae bacterium]
MRLEGASSCLDAATLAERVRKRLGNDPFDAQAKRSIEGIVRRADGVWLAEIAVRKRADDAEPPLRQLKSTAPDCASLGDAIVLAVALAIDPEAAFAATEAEEPPPPPAATRAPVPPPPPALPLPPSMPRVPPQSVRLGSVTASAVFQVGALPRASLGAGLFAAAALGSSVDVGIGARVFPSVRGDGEPGFEVGASVGTLQLCPRLRTSSVTTARVCAGPSLGVMHAVLLTGERAQPGERLWLAAEAGADFTLDVSKSLALMLGAGGLVPITRYRFSVEGTDGTLFRQSALALVAQLGVELRFSGAR